MSFEKDTFKNPSNEKPKTMDFSLQSNATKPLEDVYKRQVLLYQKIF